ncbi:MAG: tetratricopeptide repeat protein [Kiritimatiellaeota bacterium]|nr:tetratricopeptide repeat protein [Kiritimatiellota bacterium]
MRRRMLGAVGGLIALWSAGCGGPAGEREFRAGVREYERGNWVRAKSMLEKAIVRRPDSAANAVAENYLGCAAWQLKQLPDAVKAFENSRQLNPAYAAPLYNLAIITFESGSTVHAIALLNEAALREPGRPEALEILGHIYSSKQAWPEAQRVLTEAARRAPASPRIGTALALVEWQSGEQRRALAGLNQILDRQPKYAPALFNLGLIHLQNMNDRIQAAVLFRKYLEAAPPGAQADYARQVLGDLGVPAPAPGAADTGMTVSGLLHAVTRTAAVVRPVAVATAAPPRTVEMDLREAAAEAEQGRTARALALYLEAAGRAEREQNPALQEKALTTAVRNCFDQARAYVALGRFQLEHGRPDVALKSYKQALAIEPKLVMAQLGLAAAATQTGEFDAALVSLKLAVQTEPQNAEALWVLAQLYDQSLGSGERAEPAYRQFIRMFPGDPRVLKAQERLAVLEPSPVRPRPRTAAAPAPGAVAADAGQAIPGLKAGGLRNSHAAALAYNRARTYQAQQDWDSAILYYQRAIENDPGMVNACFNLGVVFSAKGDAAAAREAYERAVRIQPGLIDARYNLALIYRELKERAAAIAQLRAILIVQADYGRAYYGLGFILSEDPQTIEQARQAYRRFLELAPHDPAAANVRDWLSRH